MWSGNETRFKISGSSAVSIFQPFDVMQPTQITNVKLQTLKLEKCSFFSCEMFCDCKN